MPTLPWFKFEIAKWIMDPNLSKCHPATRGVWIDLIVAMHQRDRSGELRETVEELSRIARTSTVILDQALTELQTTGTADVTIRNNVVTVVNRLMKREFKSRQSTALRVKKHRCNKKSNADETGENKEVRSKKKEIQHTPEESKSVITRPDLSESNLFRKPKIPALETVQRVFAQQGGTGEMAQRFFDGNQATDWYLKGSPIMNFSNLVPSYIANWKANETGNSQPSEKRMVV
jgi:hypothetical protein